MIMKRKDKKHKRTGHRVIALSAIFRSGAGVHRDKRTKRLNEKKLIAEHMD
jgi:hypothetical protein